MILIDMSCQSTRLSSGSNKNQYDMWERSGNRSSAATLRERRRSSTIPSFFSSPLKPKPTGTLKAIAEEVQQPQLGQSEQLPQPPLGQSEQLQQQPPLGQSEQQSSQVNQSGQPPLGQSEQPFETKTQVNQFGRPENILFCDETGYSLRRKPTAKPTVPATVPATAKTLAKRKPSFDTGLPQSKRASTAAKQRPTALAETQGKRKRTANATAETPEVKKSSPVFTSDEFEGFKEVSGSLTSREFSSFSAAFFATLRNDEGESLEEETSEVRTEYCPPKSLTCHSCGDRGSIEDGICITCEDFYPFCLEDPSWLEGHGVTPGCLCRDGLSDCLLCDGSGRLMCLPCQDSGEEECSNCQGICIRCHGSGFSACSVCNLDYQNTPPPEQTPCGCKYGFVKCADCKPDGSESADMLSCLTCEGTHFVGCKHCDKYCEPPFQGVFSCDCPLVVCDECMNTGIYPCEKCYNAGSIIEHKCFEEIDLSGLGEIDLEGLEGLAFLDLGISQGDPIQAEDPITGADPIIAEGPIVAADPIVENFDDQNEICKYANILTCDCFSGDDLCYRCNGTGLIFSFSCQDDSCVPCMRSTLDLPNIEKQLEEARLAEEARIAEEAPQAEKPPKPWILKALIAEEKLQEKKKLEDDARLAKDAQLAVDARLIQLAEAAEAAEQAEKQQLAKARRGKRKAGGFHRNTKFSKNTRLTQLAEAAEAVEEARLAEEAKLVDALIAEAWFAERMILCGEGSQFDQDAKDFTQACESFDVASGILREQRRTCHEDIELQEQQMVLLEQVLLGISDLGPFSPDLVEQFEQLKRSLE